MNEQDKLDKDKNDNPENIYNQDDGQIKRKNPKWDFFLKILSVIAAILIWFWVVGFETQITTKKFASIPVYVENLNELKSKYGYSIIVDKEIYIDVTLEGKSSDLNRVKFSDIYAYVDVGSVTQSGEISLPIEIKEMDYVYVVDQSQSSTLIYIDKYDSTDIPVIVEIVQMVIENDVDIGELKLSPARVEVYGPKGILDTLDHAQVSISLGPNQISRSVKVTEKFILINENGEEVKNQYITTKDINAITVEVPVTITKEVPVLLNYKYGYYNSQNANINIIPDRIKIKGSPDDIENISGVYIKELIDEKKYENDATVTSSIVLPEGIESLDGETAQIEIKFIDSETKIINVSTKQNVNFNVISPKNSECHIKEDRIQIKILGPAENLKRVNSSGIEVTADLSAYEKGSYSDVPLDISVISDDSVFCVGEYKINVEIY